ncbi:hypothetical protein CesoFtcFv8_020215 [Champsocephalus esox]|uniref:Uncharacterized protein n=2 Tax=Champsocephalus esox TaxID=159716 RepID=A0AAN8BF19_9TELE|nr:hypothetical protein CesoFtcFv8_020215 [Champsocephalus esox]
MGKMVDPSLSRPPPSLPFPLCQCGSARLRVPQSRPLQECLFVGEVRAWHGSLWSKQRSVCVVPFPRGKSGLYPNLCLLWQKNQVQEGRWGAGG